MRRCIALAVSVLAGCALPVNGLGNGLGGGAEGPPDAGSTAPVSGPGPGLDASGDGPADDAELGSSEGGPASETGTTTPDDASAGSDAIAIPEAGGDVAPPDATPPLAGDALSFSGGAYVDVGTVGIPQEFSIEAWIHPTSVGGETSIVAQDRNHQAAGQFRLGLVASRQLFFIMSDASGNTGGLFDGQGFPLQSAQPVPLGAWTHVAVTRSKQTFTLYVDGGQAGQFTVKGGPPLAYGGPAVPLRIAARVGPDGSSADEAFTGTLDEVRFWSVARTGPQIASSMHATVSPSSPGLLAYWRFDDGAGSSASDAESKYPGTLVSGPLWVPSTAF